MGLTFAEYIELFGEGDGQLRLLAVFTNYGYNPLYLLFSQHRLVSHQQLSLHLHDIQWHQLVSMQAFTTFIALQLQSLRVAHSHLWSDQGSMATRNQYTVPQYKIRESGCVFLGNAAHQVADNRVSCVVIAVEIERGSCLASVQLTSDSQCFFLWYYGLYGQYWTVVGSSPSRRLSSLLVCVWRLLLGRSLLTELTA